MGFTIKSIESKKTKKPAAKKPAPKTNAKKAAPAKKPASEKPAAKVQEAPAVKAEVKRVPPRIVRKAPVIAKAPPKPVVLTDTSKAIAFAMSIAQEMKRSARNEDQTRRENEIRLSRRPTTRAHGKNTVKFPAADLKDFRKRLLEAREVALQGADAMKATGFNESGDHEADGGDGTNQTLRLQALGQMGNINRTIQQIEEALHRIEDGTYGVCTVCGQLIRKPRLLNQPFVLTCMECQSEMERQRG
ncbi:MAG: TraR/DksA C4-type zinc finger protein [Kiritimatiellae bacterium]|nr:TraR/DksA C4-type zinc finger protein [Kiritimatiellia bacterium]